MHIETSIIVPVFNRARALRKCVHSIVAMEYEQWELIIVDDGSTDITSEEIEELKKEYSSNNIHSIRHKKCLGISASRNTGIKEARGKYIFFTDSDCIVATDWVSKQLDVFSEGEVDCLSGYVDDVASDNYFAKCFTGCHLIYQNKFQKRLLIENNMSFKSSVFKEVLFNPAISYGGDGNYLAWKLLEKRFRFGYAVKSRVKHLHPIDFKEFSRIAFLQGKGEALVWVEKKSFIGRDILFLFLSLLFFLLGLVFNNFSRELLLLSFVAFIIQLILLFFNEVYLKNKTMLKALWFVPGQIYFCSLKLLGSFRTYLRLVCGK